MKTPDSRPRFQSSTRHYHRYREENRDGWSEWIAPSKKTGPVTTKKTRPWGWIVAAVAICGLVGLVASLYAHVF